MQFLLVICLMVACLPLEWPEPPFDLGLTGSILAVSAVCIFLILCSALISYGTVRALKTRPRESVAHRYDRARACFFFANLISFWMCLAFLGWGWSVREFGTVVLDSQTSIDSLGRSVIRVQEMFLPGMELVILAPFLLTMIGSWLFFYDAERRFHQSRSDSGRRGKFWSRLGYVSFQLRQRTVFLMPLVMMIGLQAVIRGFPEWSNSSWMHYAMLFVTPIILIVSPLLIASLLALKPLPVGPTRARLEANARRLGFRYSNILHWETRGSMANAMVVGAVPWFRYVVFTDQLLEEMTADEVDGVFGHEVGHAWHGHVLFYAAFLMLSLILMGALHEVAHQSNWLVDSAWKDLFQITPFITMGIYMFSVFGFVSRRCERQADLFGCKAVSCNQLNCHGHDSSTPLALKGKGLCRTGIGVFIQALERVKAINGMDAPEPEWRGADLRGKLSWIWRRLTGWLYTWQHSTIPKRIAFLERVARDPSVERRFQCQLGILKWAIILGLLGGLAGLVMWKGWNVLEGAF